VLEAASFDDLPGKWQAAVLRAEQNRPRLRADYARAMRRDDGENDADRVDVEEPSAGAEAASHSCDSENGGALPIACATEHS
jgi:hypothetical protein